MDNYLAMITAFIMRGTRDLGALHAYRDHSSDYTPDMAQEHGSFLARLTPGSRWCTSKEPDAT